MRDCLLLAGLPDQMVTAGYCIIFILPVQKCCENSMKVRGLCKKSTSCLRSFTCRLRTEYGLKHIHLDFVRTDLEAHFFVRKGGT